MGAVPPQEASAVFRGDLYTIAATDGQTRTHLAQLIVEETSRVRSCTVLCLGHNRGWEECASSFAVRPPPGSDRPAPARVPATVPAIAR